MYKTLLEPKEKVPMTYSQYASVLKKYGWRINSDGKWSMPADLFLQRLTNDFLPNVRFHIIVPLLSRER